MTARELSRRGRHRDRQAALTWAVQAAFTDHDGTTLDAATDVLRHPAVIYD